MLLAARDAESGAGLTDQELRDATVTLLLAGHETTANALAWTFCLVSQADDVQAKLQCELKSVVASRSPAAHPISSTLRIWARRFRKQFDCTLQSGLWSAVSGLTHEIAGYRIPARSTLLISPYVLHRHPDFWQNA